MEKMKRFNFMLREDIRKDLEELIPPGERSKLVNNAIKRELFSLKRAKLTEKLMKFREKSPCVSTEEIIELINTGRQGAEHE